MQIEDLNNLYPIAELAVYAALVLLLVCAAVALHAWASLKNAEADAIDWETEYRWAAWREDAASGGEQLKRQAAKLED